MSHDTDKLIRQLSLVAFLMAERRPLTARDVKQNVEGYQEMSDEAFARRFYSDRAELLALGRPARLAARRVHGRGAVPAELRALLPAAARADRRGARGAPDVPLPARGPVRLRGAAAPGAPEPRARPSRLRRGADGDRARHRAPRSGLLAGAPGPAGEARGRDLEEPDAEVRVLVDHARRAERADGECLCAALRPRPVVRRRARPRRREGQDVPRFRIRGDIRLATRRERDFRLPEGFDAEEYRQGPPWQVGETMGEAEIEVGGDTAWWVDRLFGRYGRIEDGVFVTDYSRSRAALVLDPAPGRACDPARRLPSFGARCARTSTSSTNAMSGKPPKLAAEAAEAAADTEEERPASPVPPERFGLLQSLLAYLLDRCGDDTQAVIPASDITSRFNIPPESLEEHLQLLNLVNFGGGCYAVYTELQGDSVHVDKELFGDTFRSPPRLTPLEARAIRLALEFVGPMIAADAHTPLERVRTEARGDVRPVRPGPDGRAALGTRRGEADRDAQRGHPPAARRRDRVPEGGRGHALDEARRAARDRAPAALLVRAHLGSHARRAALVPARPDAERTAPAGDVRASRGVPAGPARERRRRRQDLVLEDGSPAGRPRRARGSSPTARRSRTRPSAARSGSLGEILADRGEAVLLEPENLRKQVARRAKALARELRVSRVAAKA